MLLAPSCGRILTSVLQSTRLGANISFAFPSVQWKLKFLVSLVYRFWLPFCACSLAICQCLLLPSSGRSTHREPATGYWRCAGEASRGLMTLYASSGTYGQDIPSSSLVGFLIESITQKNLHSFNTARVLFATLPASFHSKSYITTQYFRWGRENLFDNVSNSWCSLTHSRPIGGNHKPKKVSLEQAVLP